MKVKHFPRITWKHTSCCVLHELLDVEDRKLEADVENQLEYGKCLLHAKLPAQCLHRVDAFPSMCVQNPFSFSLFSLWVHDYFTVFNLANIYGVPTAHGNTLLLPFCAFSPTTLKAMLC